MREIEFINKRYVFMAVSAICVLLSFCLFIFKGLNLGLDFTGGALVQVKVDKDMTIVKFRKLLSEGGLKGFSLQEIVTTEKDKREYIIRVKTDAEQKEEISSKVRKMLADSGIEHEVLRVEYVGPAIGKLLRKKALSAITFSLLGIIAYVGIRFKSSIWGIAGVVALFHDIVLTVGFLSFLGKEITLTVIAALLTLGGYSVNDTIVIFDRIMENLYLSRKDPLDRIMNKSINQMLKRTLLTSGTTFVTVLCLFILGNEVIKDFALTLVFGVIVGTYSSIYIASSLVLEHSRLTKAK